MLYIDWSKNTKHNFDTNIVSWQHVSMHVQATSVRSSLPQSQDGEAYRPGDVDGVGRSRGDPSGQDLEGVAGGTHQGGASCPEGVAACLQALAGREEERVL